MRRLIDWITTTDTTDRRISLGLLWLRIGIGGFMLTFHGWGKLSSFGERWGKFGDPLGIGPHLSLILAIFAEFFCSIAIIFGFMTRAAAIPPLIAMLVAAGIVHVNDPWSKQEFALMYAIPYLALILAGSGKYSLDAKLFRRG